MKETVSVWLGSRDQFRNQAAAGAGALLDHQRLAQSFGDAPRQEPRQGIKVTADAERHDQPNRAVRKRAIRRSSCRRVCARLPALNHSGR